MMVNVPGHHVPRCLVLASRQTISYYCTQNKANWVSNIFNAERVDCVYEKFGGVTFKGLVWMNERVCVTVTIETIYVR